MKKDSRIYVAGHTGLVGSAILRLLQKEGYTDIITTNTVGLDLRNVNSVESYFDRVRPEYVFLAAARVGGIQANKDQKGQFIRDNLLIQTNVIHSALMFKTKKLLFLGSSCIYPKLAETPIKETSLLMGALEESNDAYAVAKIAGIQMCKAYREQYGFNAISLMPCNIYGPGDNFHVKNSHVLAALIDKFYRAVYNDKKSVTLWGDGTPLREFLHSDDLASACLFCMEHYNSPEIINIGTGKDLTIRELANIIAGVAGYTGEIWWDSTKPNGTHRKVLDVSLINDLGWKSSIPLIDGITSVYNWYKIRLDNERSHKNTLAEVDRNG